MKLIYVVLATAVVMVGYNLLAKPSAPPSSSPSPSPTPSPSDQTSQITVINVEAGSFYYDPNVITVKKGQPVKIVMTSVDMMHDFVVDELNLKLPIVKNGETGEIEFTPDTVGEFVYYCSVGQHRANGQVGTLIVTE